MDGGEGVEVGGGEGGMDGGEGLGCGGDGDDPGGHSTPLQQEYCAGE